MRVFLGLFFIGLISGALFSKFFKASEAASPAPKNQKIEDPSLSGLKVNVPSSAEAENALVEKEKALAEQERKIKAKEAQMKLEEDRLQARLEELTKLYDEVASVQNKNKEQGAAVLARLVKTFESMQPKKASGIISVMEDKLAVELLLSMKEKKVAVVLEAMDPNRAMTLSSLVAQRRPAGRAIGEKEVP